MTNFIKFMVLLLLMVIILFASSAILSGRLFVSIVGAIILSSIMAGIYFYKRAQRKTLLTSIENVEKDRRAPVIYLRSFSQEKTHASFKERIRDSFSGDYIPGVSFPTREEEQHNLAKYLNQIGPYIALGRPGEALPFPGAAKVYIADSEWRDTIRKWIDRAAAVVLEPGVSGKGLSWEIRYIVMQVIPTKILVILPRVSHDYKSVREYLCKFFPKPLPDKVPRGTRLLTFKPNWEPAPISSLIPFFKQNGFAAPKDIDPYF